jgi:hypothetical protein
MFPMAYLSAPIYMIELQVSTPCVQVLSSMLLSQSVAISIGFLANYIALKLLLLDIVDSG